MLKQLTKDELLEKYGNYFVRFSYLQGDILQFITIDYKEDFEEISIELEIDDSMRDFLALDPDSSTKIRHLLSNKLFTFKSAFLETNHD
jgi:hypothetical protein